MVILTIMAIFLISCCATPKTTVRVRNNANGTETNINVRNGEGASTSVNVTSPVSLDSLSFKFGI